jgi:hypothetical protein
MNGAKFCRAKNDDHLIIFLGQISKGDQGRGHPVVLSCYDGEEGLIKILRQDSQKRGTW